MTDEQLIRKIKRGDPAGLEALMDRYIPYVSAVVWNILRHGMNREDAEEVVSDVFLAAWSQASDLRSNALKAWLGSVARHKAWNKLRTQGFEFPLEEDILELPGAESPEENLTRKEEAMLVRRAVDSLGEPDREVFLRHYFHAQTVQEISQVMCMNESTVKTRLRRGRCKLKDILTRWGAR